MAAAVFGVHPVHVESVTWITERKNVLSGLCYVAALRMVLPLFDVYRVTSTRSSLIGRYLIATLLFSFAMCRRHTNVIRTSELSNELGTLGSGASQR